MTPDRLTRIATAVLMFCALLVLAPSRLPLIWEHARPVVRALFLVPLVMLALQVLALATQRGWLMLLGAIVAALAGLASLFVGGISIIIATFTGSLDVITSFFAVGVYGLVVALHLTFTFRRRQPTELAAPAPPRTL
ncbi:MAG: hypothetical protein JNM69_23385 [Archangium sp.]|nr:hypothetical protein [Archangium sp.]